jgi:hypothetical protein
MTDGQRRLGRVALTLSLVGLALISLESLATQSAPLMFILCGSIPIAVCLEIVALVCGIVAARTRPGKVAVGIACLSLGLFGALVLPWFFAGPYTIGP